MNTISLQRNTLRVGILAGLVGFVLIVLQHQVLAPLYNEGVVPTAILLFLNALLSAATAFLPAFSAALVGASLVMRYLSAEWVAPARFERDAR